MRVKRKKYILKFIFVFCRYATKWSFSPLILKFHWCNLKFAEKELVKLYWNWTGFAFNISKIQSWLCKKVDFDGVNIKLYRASFAFSLSESRIACLQFCNCKVNYFSAISPPYPHPVLGLRLCNKTSENLFPPNDFHFIKLIESKTV